MVHVRRNNSSTISTKKRRFLLKKEAFRFHKQLLEAFGQCLKTRINHHERFHINHPNHSSTLAKWISLLNLTMNDLNRNNEMFGTEKTHGGRKEGEA